ncbi:hypothetical protein KFL_001170010, partial [Klebsormidium nitens]
SAAQQSKKSYPSDKIRYNEKVKGRSTNITLNPQVAAKLFEAQELLKNASGKPLSTPATVGWLLENCQEKLQGLVQATRAPDAAKQGGTGPGLGGQSPGGQDDSEDEMDLGLLSEISPSRVLPALRKKDAFFDERTGFLDLDDPELEPDFQELESEQPSDVGPSEKEEKLPSVYLGELSKLAEFVALFPPVCHARGCGCRMAADRVVSLNGTAVIHLKCTSGEHSALWRSADEDAATQIPLVTRKFFHAALCAGMGFTELSEFSEELGLQSPSEKLFYRFQNGVEGDENGVGKIKGWCEAVLEVAAENMAEVRAHVKERDGEEGTVVFMDARFDSSRDGYHGTVPALDMKSGKCVNIVTLTREETGSSWKTEDAAVRQAVDELIEQGVKLVEVVHDDKASVDSILAELDIDSQKDLWHKCKKLVAYFNEEVAKAKRGDLTSLSEARCAQDLQRLTVAVLKEHLKAAKLDLKGKKDELVDRLWKSFGREEEEVAQDTRLLKHPALSSNRIPDKLKTHVYNASFARAAAKDDDVAALCKDIHNAADHWAGDHSVCAAIDPDRKCVKESWDGTRAYYEKGGETHLAVKQWLQKKCTPAKMKFYTRARENYLSETFNSLINKYATKRIHYSKSHLARVACAALDWNEGRDRVVLLKKALRGLPDPADAEKVV